jgi:ribokinase
MNNPVPKKKIVVVGSSNTDMIIKTPRIPRPGETVVGGDFFMTAGGKGANQAVAAARAGGDVVFIARVGDDPFGKQQVDGLARDGINIDYVVRDKEAPSGIALICVAPDGENSITVAPGANGRLSPDDVKKAAEAIASASLLLTQLETPFETIMTAAGIASAAGVPVILNPAPAQPLKTEIMSQVTYFTPNETEAEMLSGMPIIKKSDLAGASMALLAKGIKTVLITLGAQGVYVATPQWKEHIPAFHITPIDTTAAGDVFNGALAVALAEKSSLPEAVRFASAAAALSTTKVGAQPSIPFRKEIEDFLRESSSRP